VSAWGVGVYESDDGVDWASEIQASGLSAVEAALEAVTGTDFIDTFEASGALVAADVVARLQRGGGEQTSYAEPVTTWVEDNSDLLSDHLVATALAALERITAPDDNELYEEWEASGEIDQWLAVVTEIRDRLATRG
jgi:hypothetical protein